MTRRTTPTGDKPVFRVVFPERKVTESWTQSEVAYGPYATLAAAKGCRTRETNTYYGSQKRRTDGKIQRSEPVWVDVEE